MSVARGLANPWAVAFLPDGRFLVTERAGRLRIVERDGRLGEPVAGLPAVDAGGQCGLLDVVLDPKFADNALVYWSYAEAGEGGNSTAVARGRLQGNRLADVQVIFRQLPKVSSQLHCGSRLVFARDGRLFVVLGDRFSRKDDAQKLDNHLGKVVRIEADGKVPADNPFVATPGARPEIWSLGHRNMQGAALHPQTGELWATEHGPQGGDELNVVRAGKNYGWPLLTYGRNYGIGTRIGEEGPKPGFEQPLKVLGADVGGAQRHGLPDQRPLPRLEGQPVRRHAARRGAAAAGARRRHASSRKSACWRSANSRIRDVRQGPDGCLYVLTDSADGQLLRLQP